MTNKDITPRAEVVEFCVQRARELHGYDCFPAALHVDHDTAREFERIADELDPAGGEGGDKPHHGETARMWLGDNGNLYRWSEKGAWEAIAVDRGLWLLSVFEGPDDMAACGYKLVEVPAAVAGEQQ